MRASQYQLMNASPTDSDLQVLSGPLTLAEHVVEEDPALIASLIVYVAASPEEVHAIVKSDVYYTSDIVSARDWVAAWRSREGSGTRIRLSSERWWVDEDWGK